MRVTPENSNKLFEIKKENFIYYLYDFKSDLNLKMYGVAIKNINTQEIVNINDVTTLENVARKVYNKLIDNYVYPEHFIDVVSELTCE